MPTFSDETLARMIFGADCYDAGAPMIQEQLRNVARTAHDAARTWETSSAPIARDAHVFRALRVLPGSEELTLRETRMLLEQLDQALGAAQA